MYDIEIIPGILEKDWKEIERKLDEVLPFAKTIHIDLLDGKFADSTTWLDPEPFKTYKGQVMLELHMMVLDPIQYIESFARSGFTRFLGHIEHMKDQDAFVAKAQEFGEVGLALDGPTSLTDITVPFEDLDTILFYTGDKVGHSHQTLRDDRVEKVGAFRSQTDELLSIEVDGGIDNITIQKVYKAGATRFISTGFLFDEESTPKEQYDLLRAALSEAEE